MTTDTTLVILGASGDLTRRLLLPGLGTLLAAEPQRRLRVWGAAHRELPAPGWGELVHDALGEGGCPDDLARELSTSARFDVVDVTDPDQLSALLDALPDRDRSVLFFALPPAVTVRAVEALSHLELGGLRLALEKPFGTDLASARALNRQLAAICTEDQLFRVDHFLGYGQVLNLLGLRFANRIFEPVWNAVHVERVEVVADETLALEGRAGYYDRAGALVDMIQSHLLLVLALTAMDEPTAVDPVELRDQMAHVLRATRVWGDDPVASSRRARYGAGRVGDADVPAYVDEPGVDPERATETLAEMMVEVRSRRWTGVPFVLRSGKAMAADRAEIVIHFRPLGHVPAGLERAAPPNRLTLDVSDDELRLRIATNADDPKFELAETELCGRLGEERVSAYGEILAGILDGNPLLSVRGDVAEECWRICTPVLDAWADGAVPLEEYPAGTAGPWNPG